MGPGSASKNSSWKFERAVFFHPFRVTRISYGRSQGGALGFHLAALQASQIFRSYFSCGSICTSARIREIRGYMFFLIALVGAFGRDELFGTRPEHFVDRAVH